MLSTSSAPRWTLLPDGAALDGREGAYAVKSRHYLDGTSTP